MADLAAVAEAKDEPTIPWETLKAELAELACYRLKVKKSARKALLSLPKSAVQDIAEPLTALPTIPIRRAARN